jgi:uncharacterized SAM-binding protein YcdF (DUF218 family)
MEIAFYLKKIISAFIMPLPIGLLLLTIALFYFYKKDEKKIKIFFLSGIIWIAIVSHAFFANLLLSPLENKYEKLKTIPNDVKHIVFLGGDRIGRGWEVLRLYNMIDEATIITTGYAGRGKIPQAIESANLLKESGIESHNILSFVEPKDTKEEAKLIKKLLKGKTFVLVTAAYHMPRTMMIFQNEGLNPIAAPTNYLIKDSDKIISLPNAYQLNKTRIAWHEYLGILWLKIRK